MRRLAAVLLVAWVMSGLFLTLQAAHPLPGQVVEHNAVPFRTIALYLQNLGSGFWLRQALGNLLLLMPIGLLAPVAVPGLDRWWRVGLLAAAVSGTIEIVQLWVPDRAADVDDLMLNVAGALIGLALLRLARATRQPPPPSSRR
jgi:glycopeptide antibiotics resistance protein